MSKALVVHHEGSSLKLPSIVALAEIRRAVETQTSQTADNW